MVVAYWKEKKTHIRGHRYTKRVKFINSKLEKCDKPFVTNEKGVIKSTAYGGLDKNKNPRASNQKAAIKMMKKENAANRKAHKTNRAIEAAAERLGVSVKRATKPGKYKYSRDAEKLIGQHGPGLPPGGIAALRQNAAQAQAPPARAPARRRTQRRRTGRRRMMRA